MTAVAQHWSEAQERSNWLAVRAMAWVAVKLGRPVARLLLHPVTLYYLLLAHGPARQSARYLQRVLGRPPTWRERYRHFHCFAATVLDRLYFVQGRLDRFDVSMTREQLVDQALDEGRGVFTVGAHLGSFEALHTVASQRPHLRTAMVMYPDNARMIHGVLKALAPKFELDIIAIGRPGSTLAIRDWLDGGGLVGMLADRFLPSELERGNIVWLPFLGKPAPFPDGPMRLAMLLKRRVIFMVALYHGGRRYEVRFDALADFRDPPVDPAAREALLHQTMASYVAHLEALVRELPYNWFNFHDFWREDAPPA